MLTGNSSLICCDMQCLKLFKPLPLISAVLRSPLGVLLLSVVRPRAVVQGRDRLTIASAAEEEEEEGEGEGGGGGREVAS